MHIVNIIISLLICLLVKIQVPEIYIFTLIGIFIFTFFSIQFFTLLGKTIPVKTLMVVISSLQWIVGPFLAYHIFPGSSNYYMIIEEAQYMPYVVFGELAFIAGLFLFPKNRIEEISKELTRKKNNKTLFKRGLFLLAAGTVASLIIPFSPGGLRFLLLLISYAKYVGVFYILNTNVPLKFWYLLFALSFEFIKAFKNAMFHDLILWLVYIYMMYAIITKISVINKVISLFAITVFIVLVQYIKADYRQVVWNNQIKDNTQKIALATKLASEELEKNSPDWEQESKSQNVVDRINQGWIIARIMYVVPRYEPYANGETINRGLEAALLPRILAPNKMKTGGQEYFPRFTGLILSDKTSMNLSIIGEAYANYGYTGGVIFMFILGLFYNLTFRFLLKKARKNPELLLWIPLIYFYTIRAESDFTTSINHIVKASIVTYLLFSFINKFIPYGNKEIKNHSVPNNIFYE